MSLAWVHGQLFDILVGHINPWQERVRSPPGRNSDVDLTFKTPTLKRRLAMSNEDNLRIARQSFEAWNAHDPNRLLALLADDFMSDSDNLPAPTRGREAHRQVVEMYIRAFPDLHFEIEQMLPSGDYVVTRWLATGTHKGELMGIPPTNRRGEGVHGCSIAEMKGGKIKRDWVYWDTATLLRQLGVMPAPAQPAAAR